MKKKRIFSGIIAAAMLFTAIPAVMAQGDNVNVVEVTAAQASVDPLQNGYNVIVNKATGRVITVENSDTENLAKITVEPLMTSSFEKAYDIQIWRIAPISGGQVY